MFMVSKLVIRKDLGENTEKAFLEKLDALYFIKVFKNTHGTTAVLASINTSQISYGEVQSLANIRSLHYIAQHSST